MVPTTRRIGLIIRSGPLGGRSSRDQLDVALAAASLGFELELFFMGEGVFQLIEARDPQAAGLPGGHKGWKALPGLSRVTAWMSETALSELQTEGADLMLNVRSASGVEMAKRLDNCDQSMVL